MSSAHCLYYVSFSIQKITLFFPFNNLLCFFTWEGFVLEEDFSNVLMSWGRILILTRISHPGTWLTVWGVFRQSQARQLRVCVPGDICSWFFKLPVHIDCYKPAGMSQGQCCLVKLVSIPEGPAWKAEQTQGQACEGTSHSGFSGMSLKLGVWIERNALNEGGFVLICLPDSSSCFGGFIYSLWLARVTQTRVTA